MKVCVYAIAKNEEKHVDRFMDSCVDSDLVLVCDTGSTDGTLRALKARKAKVYSVTQNPWRFDVARNTSMNLIPKNIDMCICLDLDECLQPGWRDSLEKTWKETSGKLTRASYDYIWNWHVPGVVPNVRFNADKIHSRNGYIWKHPCHETLYSVGIDEIKVHIPDLSIHHYADQNKSRGQYLGLLKIAIDEDPKNDRMKHYYARELMFHNRFQDAIVQFKEHLLLPSATWNEERSASMRFISRCYKNLGMMKEAMHSAIDAVNECNDTREPWLELARLSYDMKDWDTCYWASKKCLAILDRKLSYISDGASWGFEPHDLASISAYNLNLLTEALMHGIDAVRLNPQDERLRRNVEHYKKKITRR